VQQGLAAMTQAERRPIEHFLAQPDDDPAIPERFVPVTTRALHGMEVLAVHVEDRIAALQAGGLPCTTGERARRFNAFVPRTRRGHDARSTRRALEQLHPVRS
jgi:hypothetical protein